MRKVWSSKIRSCRRWQAVRRERWESDPLPETALDEGLISDTGAFCFNAPFPFLNRLMKILSTVTLTIALLTSSYAVQQPSFHTKGTPTGKPTGTLKPGEYWWHPELSPSGPLMVLVSVPEQTMHVYRNGILIGRSSISTGSKGHSTPGGVFSILDKKQGALLEEIRQRADAQHAAADWTGICMHSGNLPGYPAEPRLHPHAI